jgi:hypothetical protein
MFDDVPDVHRRESLGSVGVGPRGGDFHRSMILGWELGGLMMVYLLTWLMYYCVGCCGVGSLLIVIFDFPFSFS